MSDGKRNHTGHRVGEWHQRATLSDFQVREIRAKYAEVAGKKPRKGYGWIGARFGVSPWTVRDIVTYRTRADI